jgi:MFS transporter, ACS family, 4-hydroxyphenylacetate permease
MKAGAIESEEARVFRKVSRRFLWFLLILFMINFIDRTNVGFAALTMLPGLGISASTFALSLTAFATAYLLCEIPSNLILARVGARTWLARIAVTWGLASIACMFIVGAKSLIGFRVLVGIAEAGFAPGAVLYLTYWFPQYHRARAHTTFMIAQPVAGVIGATASGLLLGLNGVLGLAGWRWLFLVEGLPAVLFGILAFFYLTDRPADAKWLTPSEKATVLAALARDAEEREKRVATGRRRSITRQILSRNMLLVSFAYGCLIGNINALGSWMPQIVRAMSSTELPFWLIGLITAIPPICTMAAMPLVSIHSDRTKERFWHSVLPMLIGAAGWTLAASVSRPGLQLVGLVLVSMALVSAWPIFFTLPSAVLAGESHAAGIAFLNVCGIGGTAVSPIIMGFMKDLTGSFAGAMGVMAATLVLGAGVMMLVPRSALASPADTPAPPETAPAVTRA